MAGVTLELGGGEAVRIFGPARVEVEEGLVTILGAELSAGDRVEIGEYRSYLAKALKPARLRVSMSGRARVEIPEDGEEPLEEWIHTADKILEECGRECTAMVVGPVEAGKTSLTAVLANRSLARGIPTGIIDADVGQADIGPPGFVSLSLPGSWVIWLRLLDPVALRFVGSIEPGPVAGRIVTAVASLRARARGEGAAFVAVDTDGWVKGWGALEYKIDLARGVNADAVVVVGDPELYGFLEKSLESNVYYVRSPSVQAVRGVDERRRLRSENYIRFLEGGTREVSLKSVKIQGACIGGAPFEDERLKASIESQIGSPVKLMTRYPGGVCIIVDSERQVEPHEIKGAVRKLAGGEVLVVSRGSMKGVLAALVDADGVEHPALLVDVDLDTMTATFKTRFQGEVRKVIFGRVKLGEEYHEEIRGRILV
ncbi:conserved hypothetical protein [Aeropyrum pernix K1]|uniref:polynucleotide 5'-hydroxyl-kinase n=1 Tax=Aeropyrum pernix (strain ATCC 700893 / DSM 11879 / JCM 9820 / NBRC 100138 / K1) TaxID=272557 RepID=Q9YBE8_AERPE|nr:Clp1/GlmU family protein [Aeropyrum pernix]BAA80650.2 conserved hypothetical protein [Aeropyrum pernix K1]